MFKRAIEPTLQKVASSFPAVALQGPRQSGKTTLLKTLFPQYRYVNLESPQVLQQVRADPIGFFKDPNQKFIIDEAQNEPILFSYLQTFIDEHPIAGRFLISGSQQLLLSEKISQTLAGRIAILELLPITYDEYLSDVQGIPADLWEFIYRGGYPRPYHEKLDISLWFEGYVRTYLERDVRQLMHVRDLNLFQLFVKLCAGRHGQLLNLNALGADCGISQTTAREWLNLLESTYIIFRLPPYYRNFNKRLVKTPKLYFYDSGMVCHLLGVESSQHLQLHVMRGALFEGFIFSELMKYYHAKGRRAALYFWRDHAGHEVDCIFEQGNTLTAIEMKSSCTFTPNFLSELTRWQKMTQGQSQTYLVYAGEAEFQLSETVILPWNRLSSL